MHKIVGVGFMLTNLMLFASSPARATVWLPGDLGDLSRGATAIARGRVVAVEGRWRSADRRAIETVVTLEAESWLKGDLGDTVQFRVPGGTIGRYRNIIVGAPEFSPGQQLIVFLGGRAPALPFVLGLSQGVFRLVGGTAGPLVTPPAVLPTSGPPARVVRGDLRRRPMMLADFEREVRQLAEASR